MLVVYYVIVVPYRRSRPARAQRVRPARRRSRPARPAPGGDVRGTGRPPWMPTLSVPHQAKVKNAVYVLLSCADTDLKPFRSVRLLTRFEFVLRPKARHRPPGGLERAPGRPFILVGHARSPEGQPEKKAGDEARRALFSRWRAWSGRCRPGLRGGSFMSGTTVWAVIGRSLLLVGLVLIGSCEPVPRALITGLSLKRNAIKHYITLKLRDPGIRRTGRSASHFLGGSRFGAETLVTHVNCHFRGWLAGHGRGHMDVRHWSRREPTTPVCRGSSGARDAPREGDL